MPGFFEKSLNAENLLYRPYGGGEMVTFNFAYNMHTLRFMKWSNQLENAQLTHVLGEMNFGKLSTLFRFLSFIQKSMFSNRLV